LGLYYYLKEQQSLLILWLAGLINQVMVHPLLNVFSVVPIQYYLFVSATLFCIGVFGVLFRRNAIIIFMSVELMLNSVNLLLVAFAAYRNDANGQVFVFFVMAVAAAEVAVGLAILVTIFRNIHSVDIDELKNLKW
jgi:NADH-quinone oxidoreductase subunit K